MSKYLYPFIAWRAFVLVLLALLLALAGLRLAQAFAQGETTSTATFTNVVTYTIPTVTVTETLTGTTTAPTTTAPPPPPPSGTLLFNGDFENGICPPWEHCYVNVQGSGSFSTVTSPVAQGSQALKMVVGADDGYKTGTGNDSTRRDIYMNSTTNFAREGLDVWFHFFVRFPSGAYKPTNGEWNWFHQWHQNSNFSESQTGSEPVALSIVTGGALNQCGGNTTSAANPQIWGYVTGGDVNTSTGRTPTRFCTHQLLLYDHWYDIYEHILWSKTAGKYQLYIDGQTVVDLSRPTLSFNGSTVDVPNLELDDYRWSGNSTCGCAVTWPNTTYFDGAKLGTTREIVR